LDKLLAELGETPAAGKPASEEEKDQAQPEPVAPVENTGEKEKRRLLRLLQPRKRKRRRRKKRKKKQLLLLRQPLL
jgi:translation initiation factor 5B